MKRLSLFAVVFLISIYVTAQKTEWLFGVNKDSAIILAKDIIGNFKGGFVYDTSDVKKLQNSNYFRVKFKSDSLGAVGDIDWQRTITFQIFNEGENKALEIDGTPMYNIRITIRGKFLELFPFWKKYIDMNADMVETSKEHSLQKTIKHPSIPNKIVRVWISKQNGDNLYELFIG